MLLCVSLPLVLRSGQDRIIHMGRWAIAQGHQPVGGAPQDTSFTQFNHNFYRAQRNHFVFIRAWFGPLGRSKPGWFWGRFPFCPQVSKRCNPHRLSDDLFLDRLYVTSGRSICGQFNVIKLASGSNSRNKNTSAGNTINITITISIGSKPQRSCLVHSL